MSDGTPAGTRVATSSPPGYSPSNIRSLAKVGSRLLIAGGDDDLFASDGTQAGTVQLPIGTTSSSPPRATLDGQHAYFYTFTNNGPAGSMRLELARTDGTAAGTELLGTALNLSGNNPNEATTNDGLFYLTFAPVAGDVIVGYRPGAGFTTIADTTPQPGVPSQISQLTGLGDSLVWLGNVPDGGRMLLASDGQSAPVALAPAPVSFSQGIAVYAGEVWTAVGLSSSVVHSDGTLNGTSTVDLGVVPRSRLYASEGGLYFAATTPGGTGLSLFRSDGTAAGTTALASIGTFLNAFKPWGTGGVFVAVDALGDYTVWITDGTAAGTRKVEGLAPERLLASRVALLDNVLGVAGAGVFIGHWTREGGLEPASVEPGASTVSPLVDLFPGPASSAPTSPVQLGNTVYFVADDGTGDALFAVDASGTPPTGGGGGGGLGAGGGSAAGGGAATGGGAAGGGTGAGGSGGGGDGSGGGGADMPRGCGCQSTTTLCFVLSVLLAGRRRPLSGPRR